MRFTIFSDIHGNILALERMMKDTKGACDGFIFCGDIFGYFNHPADVVDLLMSIENLVAVLGNHDKYYLDMRNDGYHFQKRKDELVDQYGSSYKHTLSVSQLEFLKEMPMHKKLCLEGKEISIFHGTPNDLLEGRCYPDRTDFSQYTSDISFFGHTHYRMGRTIDGIRIINPGSLGQPRDGLGFSYAVYDFTNDIYHFRTVELEKPMLKQDIITNEANQKVVDYLIRKCEL